MILYVCEYYIYTWPANLITIYQYIHAGKFSTHSWGLGDISCKNTKAAEHMACTVLLIHVPLTTFSGS